MRVRVAGGGGRPIIVAEVDGSSIPGEVNFIL